MIQSIEEHTLNAWPALRQFLYDGWVLRFANGYTQRANSVNVLYPGQQDVAHKIERCIALYQGQKQPPIFRITPLAQAEGLDDLLAAIGFRQGSPTGVYLLDLASVEPAPEITANFHYWPHYAPEWEAHFVRFKGRLEQRATHQAMLQRIIFQTCFATIRAESDVVACGLGVLEGDYVGLFDIITAAEARRQGFAERLMINLLHWAKANGASTAYLQVEGHNTPAINLYRKLGFVESYQHWYRIGPAAKPDPS
jgi:ribosomal protein S18 acetylase RimI-like enzyme